MDVTGDRCCNLHWWRDCPCSWSWKCYEWWVVNLGKWLIRDGPKLRDNGCRYWVISRIFVKETLVRRTGKIMEALQMPWLVGLSTHLAKPVDGLGEIVTDKFRPVETPSPWCYATEICLRTPTNWFESHWWFQSDVVNGNWSSGPSGKLRLPSIRSWTKGSRHDLVSMWRLIKRINSSNRKLFVNTEPWIIMIVVTASASQPSPLFLLGTLCRCCLQKSSCINGKHVLISLWWFVKNKL